jgi:hypothetical protein
VFSAYVAATVLTAAASLAAAVVDLVRPAWLLSNIPYPTTMLLLAAAPPNEFFGVLRVCTVIIGANVRAGAGA